MGSVSKVISVVIRLGEFATSVIVLGLLGRFLSIVSEANSYADSRIVYTTVVSCIAIVFSIIFLPPFTYSFMAFPIDFVMFALWLVAFCLLESLTGIHTCNSAWYWGYWGFYWGGFWRRDIVVTGPRDIDWVGCPSWKAVLAFTFISSIAFLGSSLLGTYVIMKYREERKIPAETVTKSEARINTH